MDIIIYIHINNYPYKIINIMAFRSQYFICVIIINVNAAFDRMNANTVLIYKYQARFLNIRRMNIGVSVDFVNFEQICKFGILRSAYCRFYPFLCVKLVFYA